MAINFPSNPSNNQLFVTEGKAMRYNASKNKWKHVSTLTSSQITDLENRTVGVSSMSISGNTLVIQKDDSSYANVSLASFAGNKMTKYANASILPLSDLTSGTQVYVEDTDSLYITDGSGWYKIATVNLSPSLTLGVESISLTSGGSVDVNYTVNEPEDTPYTVTASSTSNVNITVYQANNTITFDTPVQDTTETITITATDGVNSVGDTLTMTIAFPTYAVSSAANNINEGSALTFNVTTTNVTNGTTLYWTLTNSGDFTTSSGSFTITGNAGSFTVTPDADVTTEGAETFQVQIRTDSISGPIVDTSDSITINDTSVAITWNLPEIQTWSSNGQYGSATRNNSHLGAGKAENVRKIGFSATEGGSSYNVIGDSQKGIAIDGDKIIIGHGNHGTNLHSSTDVAYIYERTGSAWSSPVTLSANQFSSANTGSNQSFGFSVDIDGDYAVVGAPSAYNSSPALLNGRVFVYHKNGGTWSAQQMIEPFSSGSYGPNLDQNGNPFNNNTGSNNELITSSESNRTFGRSVRMHGDFIAVGSPLERITTNLGNQANTGVVRLYQRSGTSWNLVGHVRGGGPNSKLGGTVALSNNYIIANYPAGKGRLYAYKYNNSNGQISKANSYYINDTSLSSQAYFGRSIDVSESYYDWLIVGVAAQANTSYNYNENKVYILRSNSGHGKWGAPNSSYVSDINGSNTSNVTIITAPNAGTVDSNFGCQVAIQGHANGGATALIGAQTDEDSGTQKGAVYIYQTTTRGGSWTYVDRIVGASANDFFGSGVALSNTTGAIAAPGVDVTIGGTTYTNNGEAYVYKGGLPSGE